ncbi:MAG TPA: glycosyltransferase family 87 protein [Pyrinomonadaceae bacterium]|nr:glycosyltransferase family 87 protein [Pyrinomonadaceae bacterium]
MSLTNILSRRRIIGFSALATAVSCAFSAGQTVAILSTHFIYRKDFVQFYLMGYALRAGANLYAPIPELAAKFEPHLNEWLRVSAYPPIVALIGLPLSYLPYFWAVVVWLLIEIGSLLTAVFLTVKRFGWRTAPTPVVITACFFIGWQPIYMEITLGQLMIPILLLLTLTWLALRAGKDVQAGVLLGIVVAIKLYAWPLVIFLFLARRRRSAFIAIAVVLAANALMIATVGTSVVVDYYSRVGGTVLAEYVSDLWNFSAWSIGFRAAGTVGGIVLSFAVLCCSLLLALRSNDFETGFMIMLIASTVLQPISWIHYLVTLLPAFCFVANRQHFTRGEYALALILVVLILPGAYQGDAAYAALLATWPPFLFILGLLWLTARTRARALREHTTFDDETELGAISRV